MNLRALLLPTTAAAALGVAGAATIGHDKVRPFAQTAPATVSEKAAIKYKPSLRVEAGCRPYPAVNAAGETSGGLKGTGDGDGGCARASLGSQVYGRSGWHNDQFRCFHCGVVKPHNDVHPVVTLALREERCRNVLREVPSIHDGPQIGVSPGSYTDGSYGKYTPLFPDRVNGTSAMIEYIPDDNNNGFQTVDTTWIKGGAFQDLVMWEQLTDAARTALSESDLGKSSQVPFIDATFEANLEKA